MEFMVKQFIIFFILKYHNQKEKFYNLKFHFLMWLSNVDASGVRVCKGCPIVDIQEGAKVTFGKNIWINNYLGTGWFAKSLIRVGKNGVLTVGDNSGFNSVSITCHNNITIGEHVNIGGGTRIYDTDFHPIDWRDRRTDGSKTKTAPVVIEDDVFIGTGCIIGKGRTIGARSVIAAGSVVVKDIPADCIAGGNPCKVIKMLNNQQTSTNP